MKLTDQLETVNNARRTLVTGSLAAGFAFAVQPVTAETIVTDASGLSEGMIAVKASDMEVPAYRAYPAGKVHAPVVLVVQEIFGLHEHIKDICRRLAKVGYYAIAPELYVRQGDPKNADMQVIRTIVAKVPDAQVMGDLDACVSFAREEGADTDRLGITGFCWGGRIVWLYAAHNPTLRAGVAWYGRVAGNTTPLQPRNPIDVAADLHAPVLGLYGGADESIPVDTLDAMKKAADAAGKTTQFVVYPDTPHAFHADYRPSYREGPAKDGWAKMLAWFKDNGL